MSQGLLYYYDIPLDKRIQLMKVYTVVRTKFLEIEVYMLYSIYLGLYHVLVTC